MLTPKTCVTFIIITRKERVTLKWMLLNEIYMARVAKARQLEEFIGLNMAHWRAKGMACIIALMMLYGCKGSVKKTQIENGFVREEILGKYNTLEVGNTKFGKREGIWKMLDEKGNLIRETEYRNGLKSGIYKTYYESGQVHSEGHNRNDSSVGEFIMYYKNGQMNSRRPCGPDGKVEVWYENGQLSQIGEHKQGEMHGKWISFYENGTEEYINYYEYGKKIGKWVFFSKAGDTLRKEFYRNDSLLKTINK